MSECQYRGHPRRVTKRQIAARKTEVERSDVPSKCDTNTQTYPLVILKQRPLYGLMLKGPAKSNPVCVKGRDIYILSCGSVPINCF